MTNATPELNAEQEQYPVDRWRFLRVTTFFARVIGHIIVWDILFKRLLPGFVIRTRSSRWQRQSRYFRELAIDMGGVLIKLGQFLSARIDVLPIEITQELQGLQDEVPPAPAGAIRSIMLRELADKYSDFLHIDETPLAAASLGQVYRAYLPPDPNSVRLQEPVSVVIKVQRPNIRSIVQTDLDALRIVARWVMRYEPIRRRADVPALMEEFAKTLWIELDYLTEVESAERLREMFRNDERVTIPVMYRDYCSARVIVMENVESMKIMDREALQEAGIDLVELADRLLDVYFHQIFREGFFHADPHPGNLYVRPISNELWDHAEGPRPYELIFIDFGMMGQVDAAMLENLKKVLISVSQRDARGLTDAYRMLGFFLPTADLERIIEAQAVILEQIWGRNLLEMSRPDPREVEELGQQFRDVLFDFPFQIPQEFIYLGRALGMLSGLAAHLDPQINPWYQVERYGRELISVQDVTQFGMDAVVEWLKPFISMPQNFQRVLAAAESGRLRVQMTADRATLQQLERLEKKMSRLQWAVLGAGGLIAGMLYYLQQKRDEE